MDDGVSFLQIASLVLQMVFHIAVAVGFIVVGRNSFVRDAHAGGHFIAAGTIHLLAYGIAIGSGFLIEYYAFLEDHRDLRSLSGFVTTGLFILSWALVFTGILRIIKAGTAAKTLDPRVFR